MTYTFEVVDDADPPQQQGVVASGGGGDDLLAKSRQIMVPQVRPAGVATVHRPAVTTATTVASTSAGQVRQVSTTRQGGGGEPWAVGLHCNREGKVELLPLRGGEGRCPVTAELVGP